LDLHPSAQRFVTVIAPRLPLYFHPFSSKTFPMPDSANRSNGGNNASKGQPKHDRQRATDQKPNPERSDYYNFTPGKPASFL
jgi:hypothetical protein